MPHKHRVKPKATKLLKKLAVVPRAMPWRVIEHARNVHEIRFDNVRSGWKQSALLSSDHHWDNPHSDRELMRQHLEEALALRAPVIIYGDFFCAMQGKWDKRSNKNDIRPEHAKGDYLDQLVTTAADWLAPYAMILAVIGPGNHETGVAKRHETYLIDRLVEAIKARVPQSPVRVGGFSGWVRFQFTVCGSERHSRRLWYHHGYGGGGPVTRGVIQTNRRAVYTIADYIATGHTHDAWIMPIQQQHLSDFNVVKHGEQLHICTPGYKEEFADGFGGWHIERGGPPKPIGACWLDWTFRGHQIHTEPRMAKPGLQRAA